MAGPTLSPLLIEAYDQALHRTPAKGSVLKDAVRVESGVMAKTKHFPALGRALARTRAALQPIQASPTVKRRPPVTLKPIEHYEYLDEYEVAQTNVNAMAGYAMNSREAVERGCDQWIIDAIKTPNSAAIGSAIPSVGDAKLSVSQVAKALTSLLVRGVGTRDMLSFIYSEIHFQNIAEILQLTSRDYSERGLIATGRVPPIFGMMWKGIEWRAEGGGSINADGVVDTAGTQVVGGDPGGIGALRADGNGGLNDGDAFCIAKNGTALALGTVNNMRDISWRNDINAWQIGAKLLGNSTVVDRSMVVPVGLSL